jgi:hypothetical protein
MPVPSPTAISLFSLLLSAQPPPLWGRHNSTCNYPFPIPTGRPSQPHVQLHAWCLIWRSPYTLLTSQEPDASKFRVFGCNVFAKVPDKLCRNFGGKAFRGIMVGYTHDAPGYRIYNLATRRITTSVHVVFQ